MQVHCGGYDAASGRRTRSVPCLECGRDFDQSRHGCYCSDACRSKAWKARQPGLFDAQPVPPVQDQRVPAEDVEALAGHNGRVLARLRLGPATGADLELFLGPGSAWRTRVSDVRRWLERHGETVKARRVAPRRWVYSIEVNE